MFSLIFIKEATSRKIVQKERINLKNQCRHLAIVEEEGYESAGMCITTNNNKKGKWILNSNCTFHMSPFKNYFTEYHKFNDGKVMMMYNAIFSH